MLATTTENASTTNTEKSPDVNPQPASASVSCHTLDFSKTCQPKNFNVPLRNFIGGTSRQFRAEWFEQFSWLHYNESNDSVLCFICSKQNAKGNLKSAAKKEISFITKGFTNWKKAVEKFKAHQSSDCHQTALDYEVNIQKNYGNVLEMTDEQANKTMKNNRLCLMKVIETLQYFCRQGQPIQGEREGPTEGRTILL